MVKIGCLARFSNRYEYEVNFAKKNNFALMQIWYDKRGIYLHESDKPCIETINKYAFPAIIHAVLDINEFDEHVPKLVEILKKLGHKEVIIHPICNSEKINDETIFKLVEKVKMALGIFKLEDITLYLENNSKLDPIFTSAEEVEIMFRENPELQFVLDIAHIDSYEHLIEMIKIRRPNLLHIADRHFNVVHEHLPLGQGEIDYRYIFKEILPNYQGRIILEIVNEEEDIINSKEIIESCVKQL